MSTVTEIECALEKLPVDVQREVAAVACSHALSIRSVP
jgi:hypothetical protein